MKPVFSVGATLVLAICCGTPAMAQDHGRQPMRCMPGDSRCHDASGRDRPPHWRAPPPMPLRDRPGRADWRDNGPDRGWDNRYHRGDRLRPDHRSRQYVVDDWRNHQLRRPPRGYHWVQHGSDYLLVAITTGIVVELLLNP